MLQKSGMMFFRFVTIHAFDRQTDGRTDRILIARPRMHSMQCGKKGQQPSLRPLIYFGWPNVGERVMG